MLVEFECPKCKGHLCEIQSRTQGSLFVRFAFWNLILNPGLTINELVLGQRFPSAIYNCKSCEVPLYLRSYLHCPECNTFHSGMIWSGKNAFRHWFGFFCPNCGGEIPCERNIFTRLLLLLTAPLWWLPAKRMKLEMQTKAVKRIESAKGELEIKEPEPIDYKKIGFQYGLYMYISSVLLFPLIYTISTGPFELQKFLITLAANVVVGPLVWIPGGLFFGFSMKLIMERRGDRAMHLSMQEDGTVKQTPELDTENRNVSET